MSIPFDNKISREGYCFTVRELNTPWEEILHLGSRQVVPKGFQWQWKQDNPIISYLSKGRVRLLFVVSAGTEHVLLNIKAGCIFREILFMHNSPHHPVYLVAMTECVVHNFPLSMIKSKNFITTYPHLVANLFDSLSFKAGVLTNQIQEERLSPKEMVCRFLYKMCEARPGGSANPERMCQSEVAFTLGMHRSTVARILKELRDQGILGKFTRHVLEIFDMKALFRLCNFVTI
ncbi:MAG: Crp/Fnr family transcriptional regulator [Desulfovibrio sp.]|jgi:CRP-like cAMP-binding protein|nr:Crp/Fnr family transcriptional regulator [Desulfovibrio sp.]